MRGPGPSTCSASPITGAGRFAATWVVKRKTAKGRLHRALKQVAQWCRTNRHQPIVEQQRSLNRKLRGHYGYYGITGNFRALARFQWGVQSRLAQVAQPPLADKLRMTWARFCALLKRYPLPPPRVVHSVLSRSEPVDRRAGCGKSARPDPWEPRGSDSPGRPDSRRDLGGPAIVRACPPPRAGREALGPCSATDECAPGAGRSGGPRSADAGARPDVPTSRGKGPVLGRGAGARRRHVPCTPAPY